MSEPEYEEAVVESRAMASLPQDEVRILQGAARARLKEMGASSALKKASSGTGGAAGRRRINAHPPSTPGVKTPARNASGVHHHANRVFCRPLRDLSMVMAPQLPGEDLLVPKVLAFLCDWLREGGGARMRTEGLFRKPGSASRQRQLRAAIEDSEEWVDVVKDASPLDVAGLIKQWLRELPEPLLPIHVQRLLLE